MQLLLFLSQLNLKMGLGSWFSNFKDKVKNCGMRVGGTISRIAPKVLKVGSFIAGGLSHLPGFIGTAAGYAYKGLNAANKLIESLPNSSFKDKLQDLSNKASSTVTNITPKLTNAAKSAQVIGDTAGRVIDTIKQKII